MSAGFPDEDCKCVVRVHLVVEVQHVVLFESDLAPEVLAHNALPSLVKEIVEHLLQFPCKHYVDFLQNFRDCVFVAAFLVDLVLFHSTLNELNSLELHVYSLMLSQCKFTFVNIAGFNPDFLVAHSA